MNLPQETTDRFTQETDVPTLQVRIPLLTAIGAWGIGPGLPLLAQAIRSDKPALQIPAIAAWSQLPVAMRGNSDIRAQIETWASSDNSLRFAAANAIRSTEIHTP
jgi:HEAT repeat protein